MRCRFNLDELFLSRLLNPDLFLSSLLRLLRSLVFSLRLLFRDDLFIELSV